MREEKTTADRLAAYSDAFFAVIVTIMVLELRAPDQSAFSALWPLWPTAISYAVSYLFIAIIWMNHHYLMRFVGLPDAVRRSADAQIDMDQLRPSLHGVAPAIRDRMDCAHPARVLPCSVLRRTVRVHRHCLQISSSAKYSYARAPRRCPSVRGASRGADHSLSWRASRSLCWLHSSRRASPSV